MRAAAAGGASQVTFVAAGTGAAHDASTPVAVPFPAGIVAGQFLLLHVVAYSTTSASITTPTDWTLIDSRNDGGNNISSIYWKRATGAESGSQNVTFTADIGAAGRMYSFSHGSGVEAASGAFDASADTTATAVNVTTTRAKCMAVQVIRVQANTTIAAMTGESGADYTEAVAEFNDATAGTFSCQVAQVPAAAAITGGTATVGTSAVDYVHGFAITP